MPIQSGPFLLRDDVDMAVLIREKHLSLVNKPSRTLKDGKTTYHCLVPSNWPECVDDGGPLEYRVTSISSTIEKVGVGHVTRIEGEKGPGLKGIMEMGVTTSTDQGVVVCVLEDPFDMRSEDLMETTVGSIISIRFVKDLLFVPIAIYSTHQIPDVVTRYCQNSNEALFETNGAVALVKQTNEGITPPMIAGMAAEFVWGFFGEKLDLSPQSFRVIDSVGESLHWCEETPTLITTIQMLGTYVGEVLRVTFNGGWVPRPGEPMIGIQLPPESAASTMYCSPFGMVRSLIRNGPEDSVYTEYERIRSLFP